MPTAPSPTTTHLMACILTSEAKHARVERKGVTEEERKKKKRQSEGAACVCVRVEVKGLDVRQKGN